MTPIKARGETAFPEAGEGVILRFRNSDIKRIEAELTSTWFNQTIDAFMHGTASLSFVEVLVRHGAKKDGEPFALSEELLDEIPIYTLCERVFDAACISMRGMPAKEFLEDAFSNIAEAEANGGLPPDQIPDTTSSTVSDDSVSGPESGSKSSGTSAPVKPSNGSRRAHAAN